MPGAISTEVPQTGVIVASADYIQSVIAQGVREGLRLAIADLHGRKSDIMSTSEAADYIGASPETMRSWRCLKKGPAYIKSGRRIRYKRSALDAYLAGKEQPTIDSINHPLVQGYGKR